MRTLIQQPYGSSTYPSIGSCDSQTFYPDTSLSNPPCHHAPPFGCGFFNQSNSGNQQGFKPQSSNSGYRSYNRGQYKNNNSNYKNNNGFRGRGYNNGNNYYPGGSRQAHNGNGSRSGNTEIRTLL